MCHEDKTKHLVLNSVMTVYAHVYACTCGLMFPEENSDVGQVSFKALKLIKISLLQCLLSSMPSLSPSPHLPFYFLPNPSHYSLHYSYIKMLQYTNHVNQRKNVHIQGKKYMKTVVCIGLILQS